MKIHHIGYAVKNIDQAIYKFEELGYKKTGEKAIDSERNIIIQFVENNGYRIELITSMSKDSSVYNLLKKFGNTPYHICYETEKIENKINELKNEGYILIEDLEEAPAINHRRVAFLFHKNMGVIEIVEK